MTPLSLVLYGITFSRRPQDDAPRIIAAFLRDRADQAPMMIETIRAELLHPTRRVRDILPLEPDEGQVSEADVREFLALVADGLAAAIQVTDG